MPDPDVATLRPPRRSRLLLVAFAIVAVVAALLAWHGSTRRSDVIQGNGVQVLTGVARLTLPRQLACETRIAMTERPSRLRLWTASVGGPARGTEVLIRDSVTLRVLATRTVVVPDGGPAPLEVRFPDMADNRRSVDICVRLTRRATVDLWGSSEAVPGGLYERVTPPLQDLTFNDAEVLKGDFRFQLLRDRELSLLQRLPEAMAQASNFKPFGIGAWTWWLALALVLGVAPVTVVGAVRAAAAADQGRGPD